MNCSLISVSVISRPGIIIGEIPSIIISPIPIPITVSLSVLLLVSVKVAPKKIRVGFVCYLGNQILDFQKKIPGRLGVLRYL